MNSQQLSVNRKQLAAVSLVMVLCLSGCDSFRFAVTEAQKENAWLHERVCATAAVTAKDEAASEQLCGLTELAKEQSAAFVVDYGLPESAKHGQAELDRGTLEDAERVAVNARVDSARRPDVWVLADSVMELGIALAGLVGGVYGVRIAGYLKTAREKSMALKEIVQGNELFKQLYPEQSERFKEAQRKQSASTRQIVTEVKTG